MDCFELGQLKFALVVAVVGCSDGVRTYPVTGTVRYTDGAPVRGGFVELEGMSGAALGHNARGLIEEDGSYSLKTPTIGEGAVPVASRPAPPGPAVAAAGTAPIAP